MAEARYRYPRSTISQTGFYISFVAYDYSAAPQIGQGNIRSAISRQGGSALAGTTLDNFEQSTFTETIKTNYGNKSTGEGDASGKGSVSLYVPQSLEYSYGANWKSVQFGALGSAFGSSSMADLATQAAKVGGITAATVLGDVVGGLLETIPKTSGVDTDSFLGAAFGVTFNDNTLQTFDKMETRNFEFRYILVARDAEEEVEIKKIIKFFKIAMHPSSKSNKKNNTIFLGYPYIFRIIPSGYKSSLSTKSGGQIKAGSETPDLASFLPNTRYCALKSMNVNYTPNNVISLTPGSFVTAVTLSLSFTELTNLVREDIEDFEDTQDMDGISFSARSEQSQRESDGYYGPAF